MTDQVRISDNSSAVQTPRLIGYYLKSNPRLTPLTPASYWALSSEDRDLYRPGPLDRTDRREGSGR